MGIYIQSRPSLGCCGLLAVYIPSCPRLKITHILVVQSCRWLMCLNCLCFTFLCCWNFAVVDSRWNELVCLFFFVKYCCIWTTRTKYCLPLSFNSFNITLSFLIFVRLKAFDILAVGNMRHLIVEACIARKLIDTSAYFWPGYVAVSATSLTDSSLVQVSPWSTFMEGSISTYWCLKKCSYCDSCFKVLCLMWDVYLNARICLILDWCLSNDVKV